ncbi:MAG: NUDIX hydrolase [Phycisphaerales bacterium]
MAYTYEYPRPAVTVDCVIFGLDEGGLKVLLIRRLSEPFKGRWALPGGFVEMEESLPDAAMRELQEETGLTTLYLEQLFTFGDPGRDPRGRVITIAYWALTRVLAQPVRAASDAESAAWFGLDDPPNLAFDHAKVLATALERLRAKVRYQPVGFELLPKLFTLTQLQRVYEIILDRPIDKRNFRKRVLDMGILVDSGEVEQDVAHRAAKLYRYDRRQYDRLARDGFLFEL